MNQANNTSTLYDEEKPTCNNTSCCPPKGTTVRNTSKIGRNEPCPCGSERKYKKCCGKNT